MSFPSPSLRPISTSTSPPRMRLPLCLLRLFLISGVLMLKLTFVKQSRQKQEVWFHKPTRHNGAFHFHLYFQECLSSLGHGLPSTPPSLSSPSFPSQTDFICSMEPPSLFPLCFLPVGSLESSHSSHTRFLQSLETLCCFDSLFLWRRILNEWTRFMQLLH